MTPYDTIKAEFYKEGGIKESTRQQYARDMAYVQAWAEASGFDGCVPMPPAMVERYVVEHTRGVSDAVYEKLRAQGLAKRPGPHTLASIKRRVSAISATHAQLGLTGERNPALSAEVQAALKTAKKLLARQGLAAAKPVSKPITLDILRQLLAATHGETHGIRQRAMLWFAWATGGRRRSELADARREWLSEQTDGSYTYHLPHHKGDQSGEGTQLSLAGEPAAAMRAWLARRDVEHGVEGSLFIIKGQQFELQLLALCKKAGLGDGYSAHGLRAGFITDALRQGIPVPDIMAMTGHRSLETFFSYYDRFVRGSVAHKWLAELVEKERGR